MAATLAPARAWSLHPFHGVMLAGTIPLFLGALLCDIAYWQSYQVQWTNFSSWLIAGGLVFAAIALVCALVDSLRTRRHGTRGWAYPVLLLVTWLLGFWNALVHAGDAWASMPGGLVLSVIVFVLICLTTFVAFSQARIGGAP